jgi:hypothetical protein
MNLEKLYDKFEQYQNLRYEALAQANMRVADYAKFKLKVIRDQIRKAKKEQENEPFRGKA